MDGRLDQNLTDGLHVSEVLFSSRGRAANVIARGVATLNFGYRFRFCVTVQGGERAVVMPHIGGAVQCWPCTPECERMIRRGVLAELDRQTELAMKGKKSA